MTAVLIPPDRRTGPRRDGSTASAIAMVVLGALGLVAVALVLVRSAGGAHWDQRALDAIGGDVTMRERVAHLMRHVDVPTLALAVVVVAGIALVRGRLRVALAAATLVVGAIATTEIVKNLLIEPLPGNGSNTMPSGHATIALSLALALVLVVPPRWRGLAVLAGGFVASFFAAGTLVAHWHKPGDVLAAAAVCLSWAGIALLLAGRRDPVRTRGTTSAAALGAVGACGLLLAWGVRPAVADHTSVLAGLGGTAAAVLAVVIVLGWTASALG